MVIESFFLLLVKTILDFLHDIMRKNFIIDLSDIRFKN